MSKKVNTQRCPLCDQNNTCGLAAGNSKCWCFYTKFDPAMAALVARRELDASCLCKICAAGVMSPARRKKLMNSMLKHR